MLPGFSRTQWAPASIAFSASVWLKWMSAITGIGDSATIVFSASASCSRGTATRTMSAPASATVRICSIVAVQVGGLGLGHRLHGHGRARRRSGLRLTMVICRLEAMRGLDCYARTPSAAQPPRRLMSLLMPLTRGTASSTIPTEL